jgi:endonuclease G, mitochondrial
MSEHRDLSPSDDLNTALDSLKHSRQLLREDPYAYYNEAADNKNKKAYYASLSAVMTPKERFHALNALIEATHTTQPPYKPSVELYPWIDLHPDGALHSIYSGEHLDPEVLIRADIELLQRSFALTPEELMLSPELRAERLEFFAITLPFNCEHAVPQGWFAKHEPMRGDLHHLFACEPDCNAFRGSLPFFDFKITKEGTREHCGRRDRTRFEPTAGKGAVARVVLYFFLRYPGVLEKYQESQLKTLLAWNRNSLVSLYEKHRNASIQARQGNRNPLIDYPEWAEKIDFSVGF